MDEFGAILRARRLSNRVRADQVPVPLELYLEAIADEIGEVVLRYDHALGGDEAGRTLVVSGKRCIVINGNDRPERQRFTACHELAHIVLDLPTDHSGASGPFVARSQNELLCDVFASELLLPRHLIQPRVEDSDIEFPAIEELARDFGGSLTATGSRFAAVCDRPCAFVLAQQGIIRSTSRSKSLRECGGWIPPNVRVPDASLTAQLLRSTLVEGPLEVPSADWLDDWKRGGVLQEDARHLRRWSQTLTLLSFRDDRIPSLSDYIDDDEDEEPALRPLDGVLPWPGKSRRRR